MCPIFILYSFLVIYESLIRGINVSNFHIVLIFNEYYTQIVAVFDETDAEQKQKQTCCKPTIKLVMYLTQKLTTLYS